MKRNLLILAGMVLGVLFFLSQSWAACPEDTVDSGECDTLYVEVYPGDSLVDSYSGPPWFVRFPIYVTHDVPDPYVDSIPIFFIPLCYESTNPSQYCSLSGYWNNTNLYPSPELDRSVFRHFIEGEDTLIHNWMMDLSEQWWMGWEWDCRTLNVSGNGATSGHFWMSLMACGAQDQRFGEGSRVLLATMTFKLEDITTICIDTCLWPPNQRLAFSRSDARTYFPRLNMPVCQKIDYLCPLPPFFTDTVCDQNHHENGHYITDEFVAETNCGEGYYLASFSASFFGEGVENVEVVNVFDPGTPVVTGQVAYDVTDSCQTGGYIQVTVGDNYDRFWTDWFNVVINDPPHLNLPDTWRALADYTMGMWVSASDPDNDSMVAVELDALWYEPDSLQPPTNPPSYDGGNPGLFTWVPEEADTGIWIGSFSATDFCGEVDTHQVAIEVGMLFCGDCTEDTSIDLGDVVYLINYLFKEGTSPDPLCRGDGNCDGVVEIGDVIALINYIYKSGPAPCFECCAGNSPRTSAKPDSPN